MMVLRDASVPSADHLFLDTTFKQTLTASDRSSSFQRTFVGSAHAASGYK